MIRTKYTYRKLSKVATFPADQVRTIQKELENQMAFPKGDLKTCTRGYNEIVYYRPCNGEYINDKIYMLHWNADHTVSLFM